VLNDPTLHFVTGGSNDQRELHILIGKNVEAGKNRGGRDLHQTGELGLLAAARACRHARRGLSVHRYARALLGPATVYTDPLEPELVVAVREGDVVAMPVATIPTWLLPAAPSASCG